MSETYLCKLQLVEVHENHHERGGIGKGEAGTNSKVVRGIFSPPGRTPTVLKVRKPSTRQLLQDLLFWRPSNC
jgi:hypothetical protein